MNKDELIALDDRGIAAWDTHDVDAFAAMFADNLCTPTTPFREP